MPTLMIDALVRYIDALIKLFFGNFIWLKHTIDDSATITISF